MRQNDQAPREGRTDRQPAAVGARPHLLAEGHLLLGIAEAARRLVDSLETQAPPKNREDEALKAKARAAERYGKGPEALRS